MLIRSGGIEIKGLDAVSIARKKPLSEPVLEKYVFVPNEATLSLEQSVRVCIQIALENNHRIKVKTVELIDDYSKEHAIPLSTIISGVLHDQLLVQAETSILTRKSLTVKNVIIENKSIQAESEVLIFVATDVSSRLDVSANHLRIHYQFFTTRN